LIAFEQVGVEDVGGLSDLPENVIGGIDSVRDRALVEKLLAMGDVPGGWLDLCIKDYARREAGAELRLLHRDGEGLIYC
jgi:hypothetical protein